MINGFTPTSQFTPPAVTARQNFGALVAVSQDKVGRDGGHIIDCTERSDIGKSDFQTPVFRDKDIDAFYRHLQNAITPHGNIWENVWTAIKVSDHFLPNS
jgi:hypothetical protein